MAARAERRSAWGPGNLLTTAVAIDPVLPRRVYAATAPDESNPHQPTLFLSTNRGRTWRPANRGLGDLQWMLALAVPPADNLTVFAGIV